MSIVFPTAAPADLAGGGAEMSPAATSGPLPDSAIEREAKLAALPGIRHAFFTRAGGLSTGLYAGLNGGVGSDDDPAAVMANRARMAATLGVAPDKLLTAYQIHSADAAIVDRPWPLPAVAQTDGPVHPPQPIRPRVDAIVTATPGLAVAISTADCVPVLFADAEARIVGGAHAGWKGARAGILEATIARIEEAGGERKRIAAAIGPCISQPNYEVGHDFQRAFVENDTTTEQFFSLPESGAKPRFDLPAYVEHLLKQAGIAAVGRISACTYAQEDRYFSYRRSVHRGEPDYGRQISAIVLEEALSTPRETIMANSTGAETTS